MDNASVGMASVLFSVRDSKDVDRPEVRKRISARLHDDLANAEGTIFEGIRTYLNSLSNPSNKDAARLSKTYPGRFLPFGSVHMHASEDQLRKELEEIESLELYGVKLLPTLQLFNPAQSKNFEKICDWCEKKHKLIIYHTSCDPGPFEIPEVADDANPKYLKPVLERYSPKIVLAHFGAYSAYNMGIWFEEAIEVIKKFENAYGDTSAVVDFIMKKHNIERIKNEVGIQKLLFGTDFPVVAGSTISGEAATVWSSCYLNEEEKWLVMQGNARNLLGI